MKKSALPALLVVDDNAHFRRIVMLFATAMQFNVSCACDGREAVELLFARHFDVVLTDFDMPGMNGWKLVLWMRKHRPEVPVCMMSGEAASEGFRTEIEPYVDGLLVKPFSAVALAACIKNAALRKAIPRPSELAE
jgi:two-component system chemotaxis response regulator CheY